MKGPRIPDRFLRHTMPAREEHLTSRYFKIEFNAPPGSQSLFEAIPSKKPSPLPPGMIFQHQIQLDAPQERIGNIGFCIYCGSPFRDLTSLKPPTNEHIIPEGLGGTLILEQASCNNCMVAINRFEGDIQSRLLLAPRRRLGVKGKKRPRTEKYTVSSIVNGREIVFDLPLDSHPAHLVIPILLPPKIMYPNSSNQTGVSGLWSAQLDPADHWVKSGMTNVWTPALDTLKFCQLVAKIAHSYAACIFGINRFTLDKIPVIRDAASNLTPTILKQYTRSENDMALFKYIGGLSGPHEPSQYLHEIGYMRYLHNNVTYTMVLIQTFWNPCNFDICRSYRSRRRRLTKHPSLQLDQQLRFGKNPESAAIGDPSRPIHPKGRVVPNTNRAARRVFRSPRLW